MCLKKLTVFLLLDMVFDLFNCDRTHLMFLIILWHSKLKIVILEMSYIPYWFIPQQDVIENLLNYFKLTIFALIG
jgi:hypothetical protein